jgi:hypothetical protein
MAPMSPSVATQANSRLPAAPLLVLSDVLVPAPNTEVPLSLTWMNVSGLSVPYSGVSKWSAPFEKARALIPYPPGAPTYPELRIDT